MDTLVISREPRPAEPSQCRKHEQPGRFLTMRVIVELSFEVGEETWAVARDIPKVRSLVTFTQHCEQLREPVRRLIEEYTDQQRYGCTMAVTVSQIRTV